MSLEGTNQLRNGVIRVAQKEVFGDITQARNWSKQCLLRKLYSVVIDDLLNVGGG